MRFYYVAGSHISTNTKRPMELCFNPWNARGGELYFGRETTLFGTYARARGAIQRTNRKSPDLFMEIKRAEATDD